LPPGSTCLPLPILRPPICSVGCGEVLGMFALSCDEHPAELPRRRSPVALAPLLASVVIRGSYPLRVGSPPQGQAIGYDLDPSVILAVEVFEVEVDQAGVCCYPCPRFPAYAGCCPFQGPPRARKSPDCAQAARWSPRGSRARRHRQKRADKGSGNRRRRKRSRRKRWLG
jgi:hypothetical protein